MKFLVDANLPSRLCAWLRSHRHEAAHVFDRNLLTATDTQIWERGRVENLVIFSKDVDFYDRALLFGAPPQVVHVAVGNCSNTRLFDVLASEWDDIEQALVSRIQADLDYTGENRSIWVTDPMRQHRSNPRQHEPLR